MFQHGNDTCLKLFSHVWPKRFDFMTGAKVLEIGCAEADWLTPMKQARPDLTLVGIDWRRCVRDVATVVRGNVLTFEFPEKDFDVVVLISALEHVGLGHYDHDPTDPDGDTRCMARIHKWLKPGGAVYFDVPWNPDTYDVNGTEYRAYNDLALESRLNCGLYKEHWRGWATLDCERVITERPTVRNGRFYYCANVWTAA